MTLCRIIVQIHIEPAFPFAKGADDEIVIDPNGERLIVQRADAVAVLIVPTEPLKFFPIRVEKSSVSNMASYEMALQCFNILQIPVPILLIGLEARN